MSIKRYEHVRDSVLERKNGEYVLFSEHTSIVQDLKKRIEDLEAEKRWIPVAERLPKKCDSYLVYAPESFPKNSKCMVAEFYDDNNLFYDEGHGEHSHPDVTHWLALPPDPL